MNLSFKSKVVLVALDASVPLSFVSALLDWLIAADSLVTISSPLDISTDKHILSMRRRGLFGYLQRLCLASDLDNRHLIITAGTEKFVEYVQKAADIRARFVCVLGKVNGLNAEINRSFASQYSAHLTCNKHFLVKKELPIVLNHSTAAIGKPATRGTLFLVGAGPGSSDLLTIRALSRIQESKVMIVDRLVSQELLNHVPAKCKLLYARKVCGRADLAQQEINDWTISFLERGESVTRLKCGDPYVFGRGGEEYNAFVQLGYQVEYIPGISSALSAPGIAGIPPTHRGIADQVLIVTGTRVDMTCSSIGPYVPSRTVILLMALGNLQGIVDGLTSKLGFPSDMACAVIQRASFPDELIVRATLAEMPGIVRNLAIKTHATIVVGSVVNALLVQNPNLALPSSEIDLVDSDTDTL